MNPLTFPFKALRALISPKYRFLALAYRGFYDSMPDEEYLKRMYKCQMGRELDLQNPKTLTEKLQWLKLYDLKTEYTPMADKYAVKKIISDKLGSEYVIPLIGVYDSFDEIDFDSLPDKFALKCTHDSGGYAICRGKSSFDRETARRILTASLGRNYYLYGLWPRMGIQKYPPAHNR